LGSRDVRVRERAVSRPPIWARFWRDRRGAVAVATAILLPVLIGLAGIGIEIGLWFAVQRQNQSAADAAAISAALEYTAQIESGVTTNPTAAATTTANCNLFSTSSSSSNAVCPLPSGASNTITLYPCYGFTVGVSSSCDTSSSNGTLNAVQAVLTQPLNTAFANFVTAIWGPNVNTVNVTTTAIAAFPPPTNTACILALDPSAASAVLVDNASLTNTSCWVAANSSSGSALNCNNCTIAGPTTVVGGDAVSNNNPGGGLQGSPNRTYASATADPYANVAVGNAGPCVSTTTVITGPPTPIPPGHYCGGIQIADGSTLTMSPGVYYIDGQFGIQSGSTLNANLPSGVTIIINGPPYCIGDRTCQAGHGVGGILNITAQSTGPFAGIAIFGPRNSTPAVIQEFAGTSQNNIQGAIYFPSQTIQFDLGSQINSSLCTQIIGDQIHIESNANVSTSCNGTGVTSISVLEVYLAS
jgi:Flp pilus assembly protein TadG